MRVLLINCAFCNNKIPVQFLPGLHLPMLSCGHATCATCHKIHPGHCTRCKKLPKTKKQVSDDPKEIAASSSDKKVSQRPMNGLKLDRQVKKSFVVIASANHPKTKRTKLSNDSRFKRPKVDCQTFRRHYRWKITHRLVRQNAFCGTSTILV